MFWLGLVCGVAVTVLLLLVIARDESRVPSGYDARQDILDIERQAIRQMVATSLMAQPPAAGTDQDATVEGQARDIDRRP